MDGFAQSNGNPDAVFRIDKFVVPDEARAEFLERVGETIALLRRQAGFVRDQILVQTAGFGRFNLLTLVEWRDESAIGPARAAVTAMHAARGFDPTALMARLGIEADMAAYRAISTTAP